ncbi:hypothetical protein GGS24DRAFT_442477 [Hypoxylon argillaceum]|nr:hypothetical protein GGS24DRAFT_442477 [Hypoxylon argillaceum]
MARKGSVKVRTGCVTCKVRKVKCDEGKPSCRRCTSTGRKCDGYGASPASSALSWHRPRHLFPNVNDASERRSLDFFCEVAAPVLSGPLDPYFWTHVVLQFSQMEPAVRHSVVAVGSLYEQAHRRPGMTALPHDNSLILSHYNAAIRHLKTMKSESLILLVCILFVCIEFLRDNRVAAVEHLMHGISILKRMEEASPWAKEYLSPLFRRLSVLPYFFAVGNISRDKLLCLDDRIPSFSTLGDAQFYLDGILGRTIRLIRQGDVYRLGCMKHKPVWPDMLAEQDLTRTLLDQWHSSFVELVSKSPEPASTRVHQCNMSIRYLICCVWAETSFEFYQTAYDRYLDTFRSMVDSAGVIESSGYNTKTIKFTFEMGFIPMLYFIITRCRCLDTRLRALSLMKRLGAVKENMWEIVTMFASARRIVEIEHGAVLTDDGQLCGEPSCPGLPPDEIRIRDTWTDPEPLVQIVQGVERGGRMGGFFVRTADDEIHVQSEFLPLPSWA